MSAAFDAIHAASPWFWVALAVALAAIEMATMSFYLIWPACAALVMAGLVVLMPALSGEARLTAFALLAIALTFAGRGLLRRFGDGQPETQLNERAAQVVGRKAHVLSRDGREGAVEIDGIRWHAVWDGPATAALGGSVTIIRADGMTLRVSET